jgi:hypothetical protein
MYVPGPVNAKGLAGPPRVNQIDCVEAGGRSKKKAKTEEKRKETNGIRGNTPGNQTDRQTDRHLGEVSKNNILTFGVVKHKTSSIITHPRGSATPQLFSINPISITYQHESGRNKMVEMIDSIKVYS